MIVSNKPCDSTAPVVHNCTDDTLPSHGEHQLKAEQKGLP